MTLSNLSAGWLSIEREAREIVKWFVALRSLPGAAAAE
jgi:hypothetical protein